VHNSVRLNACGSCLSGTEHLATEGWGMKSRVHPKYTTEYRVTNWAEYDRALVQRGDITLWISPAAIEA